MASHVIVETRCVVDTPHELDQRIAGFYLIKVHDGVDGRLLANAALDAFHGKVAIKELDDFEIRVLDMAGRELQPDPEQEDMSLEGYASLEEVADSVAELTGGPSGPSL